MFQCLKQEPLAHHPINMRRKMKKRRKNEGALKSCWGKVAFPARLVAPTLRRARTMGCFWEGRGAEIFEQCTDLTWYIRLIEHRLPDGTLLASAWMCISQGHLFSWPQMMLCARKGPNEYQHRQDPWYMAPTSVHIIILPLIYFPFLEMSYEQLKQPNQASQTAYMNHSHR